MKIFSCFDGISVGYHAVQSIGIQIDKYYSAEIDPYAIKVSQSNYPDIIQLGDIRKLNESNLPSDIDICIAGFSCQSFSRGGLRKAFNDPRGMLFWEFKRVLDIVKPKYFLAENVFGMSKQCQQIINDALGIQSMMIDSALLTAQRRKRLYWFNWDVEQPIDQGLVIRDILTETASDRWTKLDHYSENTKSRILRNVCDINFKAQTICCSSRSLGANGATIIQHP
ncbi:MAG: DNA cytosine methyltransferase, partial [Cyanobacteria bacterium P01_A01_bin.84]